MSQKPKPAMELTSDQKVAAARLLFERQDTTIKPKLDVLATQAPEAVARVHALWALHGLNSLEAPVVQGRLDEPDPRVREQAVALGDLQRSSDAVPGALRQLAADSERASLRPRQGQGSHHSASGCIETKAKLQGIDPSFGGTSGCG